MELANSFGTFNIATVYFPEKYSYNYGLVFLFHIITLVPFLSKACGIEQLNIENDYKYSSTLFFTNILTKGSFSSGSGTSSLADAYMDCGPWGIPFMMFFWGVIMAWICHRAVLKISPIYIFLYAYYSYLSIYVNRSSFFYGWNILIWVILLYYFVNKFYIKKSIRKVLV
jgi:hypothetical protein